MADPVPSAHEWVQSFHNAGDSFIPEAWVKKFYSEECEMRFPGQPVLKGHEAIIDFFKRQFTRLESMKHQIRHIDVLPDRIYQEATITYVVNGDPAREKVEIDGLAIFGKGVQDDKMRFFTVYLDPSPLHSRIKQVKG